MLKKPHKSHSQKWESSPKDVERQGFDYQEGSPKEEAFDKKQMPKMPKMPPMKRMK